METSFYNNKTIAELTSELSNRKIPNRSKLTTRDKKIKVLIFHDKNPSPKQLSDYITSLLDDETSKKRKELTSSSTTSSMKKVKSNSSSQQDEEMPLYDDFLTSEAEGNSKNESSNKEVDELIETIHHLKVSKTSYLIMIDVAGEYATTQIFTDKNILMNEIKKFIKQFYKVTLSDKFDKNFHVILKSSGLRLPNDDTIHIYAHRTNPIMKLRTSELPKVDNYPSFDEFI